MKKEGVMKRVRAHLGSHDSKVESAKGRYVVGLERLGALLSLATMSCSTALPVCDAPEVVQPSYDYVRVDFAAESGLIDSEQVAEITKDPAYDTLIGGVTKVAIRAPDSCQNATAAEAEGRATNSDAILKSTCGIYLKELEQALTKVGYQVVSWDVLGREEKAGSTTYDAAERLGASIVFIVNSVETTVEKPADEASFKFNYFESNEEGEGVKPLALTKQEQLIFAQQVQLREPTAFQQAERLRMLVATLDTTAVAIPARQSIWYYRRSLREFADVNAQHNIFRKFLFATDGQRYWAVWPTNVERPKVVAAPEVRSSSTEFSFKRDSESSSESDYKKRQQAMIRVIVGEFANKFKTGATE